MQNSLIITQRKLVFLKKIDTSKIILIGNSEPLSKEVKAISSTTVLFGRANFQNELYFMDTAKQFTSGIWERPPISFRFLPGTPLEPPRAGMSARMLILIDDRLVERRPNFCQCGGDLLAGISISVQRIARISTVIDLLACGTQYRYDAVADIFHIPSTRPPGLATANVHNGGTKKGPFAQAA